MSQITGDVTQASFSDLDGGGGGYYMPDPAFFPEPPPKVQAQEFGSFVSNSDAGGALSLGGPLWQSGGLQYVLAVTALQVPPPVILRVGYTQLWAKTMNNEVFPLWNRSFTVKTFFVPQPIIATVTGFRQWNGIGGFQFIPSFPQLSRKETTWPHAT